MLRIENGVVINSDGDYLDEDLVVNDDHIESMVNDVIESSDGYDLSDYELESMSEDYIDAKDVATDWLKERWYEAHWYFDVYSTIEPRLKVLFEERGLYNQHIRTEEDVDIYNEITRDVACDNMYFQHLSMMKFLGCKPCDLSEEHLIRHNQEVWWKRYEHIDDTETRVWLILLHLQNATADEAVDVEIRIKDKDHTLYKSKYDGLVEYDRNGNHYKNMYVHSYV